MLRTFVTFASFGAAVNFTVCLLAIKLYSNMSETWYGLPIISRSLEAESWLILGTLLLGHSLVWGFIAGIISATSLDETGHLKISTVAIAIVVPLAIVSALAMFIVPGFNFIRLPTTKVGVIYLQYFAVSIPATVIAGLLSQWWVNRTATG